MMMIDSVKLPKISDEQRKIVDKIKYENVIVDAVAGSGKTTTNLYISLEYPDSNILLLTYNKKLKAETRSKIESFGIRNVEVHSYHSFCVKYYKRNCFTDHEIIEVLKKNLQPLFDSANYDILILDETQDITTRYYSLILKIFKDKCTQNTKICILGDQYQSIYDFNGADNRFIKYAEKLFKLNDFKWTHLTLSTSFRTTMQIANFVNKCLLKQDRIQTNKAGSKAEYIVCETFAPERQYGAIKYKRSRYIPADKIRSVIASGYQYDDIFVLSPSVRKSQTGRQPPVITFANYLSRVMKYPIYVPTSDDQKLDDSVLKGKVVFSSFHQVKGLERKVVIIFGFDSSYFELYKRNGNTKICPNEIYVACTRALEKLLVFHGRKKAKLPFLNFENICKYCNLQGSNILTDYTEETSKSGGTVDVTALVRHLSPEMIEEAIEKLQIKETRCKKKTIDIDIITEQKEFNEEVSEITGTAIPAYYQLLKQGIMTINQRTFVPNSSILPFFDRVNINNLLKCSNEYCAQNSGYVFKLKQITDYNWLNDEQLEKCVRRLEKLEMKNPEFEVRFQSSGKSELAGNTLIGIADAVDDGTIYEFKCTHEISKEHILQLACYAYLCVTTQKKSDRYKKLKDKIKNDKALLENLGIISKPFEENQIIITKTQRIGLILELHETEALVRFYFPSIDEWVDKNTIIGDYFDVWAIKNNKIPDCFAPKFKIFNILTGQEFEIQSSDENLCDLVRYLINEKYGIKKKNGDQQFIKEKLKIFDAFINNLTETIDIRDIIEEKSEDLPDEELGESVMNDFNDVE